MDTLIPFRRRFFGILFSFLLIFTMSGLAQINWQKYAGNPVLTPSSAGEWDNAGFAGQSVLYDSNEGIYKMWYGASDGSHFRIGYATSEDGISWIKFDDPLTTDPPYAESDPVLGLGPGSFESQVVYFPTVYYDGTIYRMWYAGTNGNTDCVGYATSSDGIAWVKDTLHNPVINVGSPGSWDDTGVDPGPVKYDGTTFEMIYNGYSGQLFQAGYATSTDGITWNKADDPVLEAGSVSSWDYPRANPTAVVYNPYLSKYFMFYSGGTFLHWKIGYATADSFNGSWTKNPSVLMEGTPGEWDSQTAAFPYVLYDPDDGIYKMWYMGSSSIVGTTGGKIGYATTWVLDTIFVPNDYSTIQAAIDAASNGAVVLVDEGTYLENINFRGKAITVTSKYIVDGDETHIQNTIIDGSNPAYADSGSVVTFNSGEDSNSVICGFIITGGSGTIGYNGYYGTWDKSGGGIIATGGCRISHNIITQNEITRTTNSNGYGGGISCGPSTIIENNIISNNTITCELSQAAAGGVLMAGSGTRMINNSITDNTALSNASDWNSNGGGAGIVFGNVLISGNYIARNIALAPNCTAYPCYGGGFHAFETSESVLFYDNIVIDNLAQGNAGSYGGGINLSDGSNSIISNNVIARNISSMGGAISCIASTGGLTAPAIKNNTVSLNRATSNQGGSLFSTGGWTPEVTNSILWKNTNGNGSEVSGNFSIEYTDVEGGYPGTGNADWDPYFRDTTNNDFHLMSTDCGNSYISNCIDAGDPAYKDSLIDCDWGLGSQDICDMGAYSIPALIVGISDENGIFPDKYVLLQNYPNPFNPSTKISWQSPVSGRQTLKVYDILGREVATLVDEYRPAGRYSVEFSMNNEQLSSGVYFYRLTAGSYSAVKKMIYLK